jgi:hypothetical protein
MISGPVVFSSIERTPDTGHDKTRTFFAFFRPFSVFVVLKHLPDTLVYEASCSEVFQSCGTPVTTTIALGCKAVNRDMGRWQQQSYNLTDLLVQIHLLVTKQMFAYITSCCTIADSD